MKVHDEFCFVGDIYEESENYMCICSRLSNAREQAVEDAINAPGLHPRINQLIQEIESRCIDRIVRVDDMISIVTQHADTREFAQRCFYWAREAVKGHYLT